MSESSPEQTLKGRSYVITGGNRGLGFFTALRLAQLGAFPIIACRDADRASAAVRAIQRSVSGASVGTVPLDLTNIAAIKRAGKMIGNFSQLDGFVANAGLIRAPRFRTETRAGQEVTRATNFYGHFALAKAVLPVLERTPGSVFVSLGSLAIHAARPRLDDLELRSGYGPAQAYAQSKLALAAFGLELDRRLREAHKSLRSIVVHPGYSISGRTRTVAGVNEPSRQDRFLDNLQAAFSQGKDAGAAPIVRALTDPQIAGGDYLAPLMGVRGPAVRTRVPRVLRDRQLADAIWRDAEEVTGVKLKIAP